MGWFHELAASVTFASGTWVVCGTGRLRASLARIPAARGATVAVACAGSRDIDGGGFRVPLQIDEAAADVWSLVVFSTSLCDHVYATEHGTCAATALGLEPARRFDAEIGFDGERTSEVLDALRDIFGDRLDAAVVDKINHVAALRAQQEGPNPVEVAWQSALTLLAAHVETTVEESREEALTPTRDRSTGLTDRAGLNRWAASSTTPRCRHRRSWSRCSISTRSTM